MSLWARLRKLSSQVLDHHSPSSTCLTACRDRRTSARVLQAFDVLPWHLEGVLHTSARARPPPRRGQPPGRVGFRWSVSNAPSGEPCPGPVVGGMQSYGTRN